MPNDSESGADRSLGALLSQMTSELALLVRKELELARVETKQELRQAGQAAGAFGGAGLAAFLALLLVSFAAAWGLAELMPAGWAFLIVGALYGGLAFVLFVQARHRISQFSPVPEQTVETLKEDVEWAKARKT